MFHILRSKKFRQFAPFMILVVGGSFYLREFTKVRYEYRKVKSYDDMKHKLQKDGIKVNESTTLEEEYENMKETLNIDNWENVRISRPWEETEAEKK